MKLPNEGCPFCGKRHSPEYGETDYALIECVCGKILEWIVPLFKQSESGFLLIETHKLNTKEEDSDDNF
jgi:hypothetical protein